MRAPRHGRSMGAEVRLALVEAALAPEPADNLARLPAGRRRSDLSDRFRTFLTRGFAGRVLSFDRRAAEVHARLRSDRSGAGRPLDGYDATIAAIARTHAAGGRHAQWERR